MHVHVSAAKQLAVQREFSVRKFENVRSSRILKQSNEAAKAHAFNVEKD